MEDLTYPTIPRERELWKDEANCLGTDTEAFFSGETHGDDRDMKSLRRICGACNVKNECLEYAIDFGMLGYWGDTTEAERKRIRRGRKL